MEQEQLKNKESRNVTSGTLFDSVDRPVFFASAGLIIAFSLYGGGFSDHAAVTFATVQEWLVTNVGWFYMAVVAVFFVFIIFLASGRYAHIKLGPDDSVPDYSYPSWIAMLFSAGMGIGLLFFGVAEPITHFAQPPTGEGGTVEAARNAMLFTYMHWGLQAWATYIVVGLALAYFAFRHNLPLTVRSALYPLIGERIHGPIGHAVDTFAVLGTMFGVATSLGIGVTQVNAGLNYLFNVPVGPQTQILLIACITAMATVSVVVGLDAGIRRLSELNMALALGLLSFVLLAGPTASLLGGFVQNVGNYLSNVVFLTFNLYAYEPNEWMGEWTLFYWAWWISWSPFVGMFIARISRGRTIREFILGVLLIPAGFTFLWLSVFGNSALFIELGAQGGEIVSAVTTEMPTALFVFLERLPLTTLVSLLATLLIVTFFVTSSDSGSLVIDIITSGGNEDPPTWQRVFWAIAEGVVASVLLLAGGLSALQTAAITSALPFSVVMLFICYGLYKGLLSEGKRHPYRLASSSGIPMDASPGIWKNRLRALIGQHRKQDVQQYLQETVKPAMENTAKQLDKTILNPEIEAESSLMRLRVQEAGQQDFVYEIRLREYTVPSVAFPELPPKGREKTYWRAEVYIADEPQHYDVAGFSAEQLVSDMLSQFDQHMQFFHSENRELL
jgi:choline/glycine/proline betaine transport protein